MNRPENWNPIFVGPEADLVFQRVLQIGDELRQYVTDQPTKASLSGGQAGLAFFFGQFFRATACDPDRQLAQKALQNALQQIEQVQFGADFFDGLCGITWSALVLDDFVKDMDTSDICAQVDSALEDWLKEAPWMGQYDLVSGLVGFGVYLLNRLPDPRAQNCISLILDRLEEMAQQDKIGCTWHTRPELLPGHQRVRFPDGYYNLGLAHGVSGIIGWLALLNQQDLERKRVLGLLEKSTQWLLLQQNPERLTSSRFAHMITRSQNSYKSRLAWCYGDLGIAAALHLAAMALQNDQLQQEANSIAHACSLRVWDDSGVQDGGLCHGSSGIGHIFNRFYHWTGETHFKGAAGFWFEKTMHLFKPEVGAGGYPKYTESITTPEKPGSLEPCPWLLEGSAGVGLALLSACKPIAPIWDRFLLLS